MGGQPFQHMPADSSPIANEQDQATLVARGQQNAQVPSLSQPEVIASSSENLFHPVSHDPSAYVFKLPNVPSNPRFHAYNPIDTFQRLVTYRSPFSSYNNPAFRVPSNPPHAFYNRAPISPITALLPQPPPPPPRIHPRNIFPPQQQYDPTYIRYPQMHNPPPAFNHLPQTTYNPPPAFN